MNREIPGYQPEQEKKKKTSRRNFLKIAGAVGASLASETLPGIVEQKLEKTKAKQVPDISNTPEARRNEPEILGEELKRELKEYLETLEKDYGKSSSKERLDVLTQRVLSGLEQSLEKQTGRSFSLKAKKYLDNLKENGFQDYYEHMAVGAMGGVILSKGFDKFAEPVSPKVEVKRATVFANIGAAAGAAFKVLSGEGGRKKEYIQKEALRAVITLMNGTGMAQQYEVQSSHFRPDLTHENILKANAALNEFLEKELNLKDPVHKYAATFEILDRQRQ